MDRSFRLIDVIVVGGCLAMILMGLVMSGEHRGGGRRMQCSSNMRQVGLALIQYANTHQKFPPSQLSETGTSGLIFALPYLESQDLYNAYNLALPRWAPENEAVVGENIQILNCPMSETALIPKPAASVKRLDGTFDPGISLYATGSYAVNWGGGRSGWGRDFERSVGRNRGVMRSVPNIKMRGPLPLIGEEDLKDGASTTLLLTEKRDSQGWPVGGWAGSEFDVGKSPGYEGGDPWGDKVYSGSYHPGGVNMVFCDGSAKFIQADIDRRVWYAIITRDGGETIDADDLP